MQWRAELVHAESGVRVVQLSAWQEGQCLGSTLAEAQTVEEAERKAEGLLRKRLTIAAIAPDPPTSTDTGEHATPGGDRKPLPPPRPMSAQAELDWHNQGASAAPTASSPHPATLTRKAPAIPIPEAEEIPKPLIAAPPEVSSPQAGGAAMADHIDPPGQASEAGRQAGAASGQGHGGAKAAPPAEPPPLDPEDWSDELAQIDLQLQRLGWKREQEGLYLERAFGHASRSRITTYSDVVAYSQALSSIEIGSNPATVAIPLRRRDLLHQCDQLLAQLQWSAAQGRAFLEQHFQLSSRSQLNDEQLLHFNMMLEGETLAPGLPEK